MDRERLNLAALDPAADVERWEGIVGSIMERAEPELHRRRVASRSILHLLAGWARPALAAAAILAAISTALLTLDVAPPAQPLAVQPGPGIIETLQIPEPVATWLTEERGPTVDDLLLALEGGPR